MQLTEAEIFSANTSLWKNKLLSDIEFIAICTQRILDVEKEKTDLLMEQNKHNNNILRLLDQMELNLRSLREPDNSWVGN
jgi:hypothetical protein